MYNRYETLMDRQVKGKAVDTYSTLNEVLVNLFRDIMDIEQKAIVTQEFQDITNNDMHVIEAVGTGEGDNMSSIAKKLGITVGSLTIAMNHLVKKKYVERCRSEKDRRVVVVKLTEKGVSAYKHHEDYHRQMTEAVMDKLNETEMPVLMKMLDGLTEFFTGYSRQQE